MKHFKGKITRLIKLINEKFPDNDDLYGFAGINKNLLVVTFESIYSIACEIDENNEQYQFEIIALKRLGADVIEQFKNFIDRIDNNYEIEIEFNQLLHKLSDLYEKTKIVYFIINKNGIRNDIELSIIKEKIENFSDEAKNFEEVLTQIKEKSQESNNLLENIKTADNYVKEAEEKIKKWESSAENNFNSISDTYDKINGWDETIESYKDTIESNKERINNLLTSSEKLKKEIDNLIKNGETASTTLSKNEDKNIRLLTEIEKTLADANRLSMAGSFKERKEELVKTQRGWQLIFIISIIIIVSISTYFFLPQFLGETNQWDSVPLKISIISPLIWLAWFAARQYGFALKVKEDYAFKYASAMAYEGYSKETQKVDPQLEKVLLEFSLYNMALNPIRLYNKKDENASPIEESLNILSKKLPNLKKATVKSPTIGEISVEAEPKTKKNQEPNT